jgi:hypothetical protein
MIQNRIKRLGQVGLITGEDEENFENVGEMGEERGKEQNKTRMRRIRCKMRKGRVVKG